MATSVVAQQIEDMILQLIVLSHVVPEFNAVNVNVCPREMPEVLDKDPSPVCVVCVGNEKMPSEAEHDKRTNTTNIYEYPALIVIAKKTALVSWQSDPWKRAARKALRDLLFRQFLLGADGAARRCRYIAEPEINTVGFQRDYKVSGQMFLYRCEEMRVS
jgi:hypothetical protein